MNESRSVFILCGGKQTRFADVLDYPKQFIQVGGQIIIERTIAGLRKIDREWMEECNWNAHREICVVAPDTPPWDSIIYIFPVMHLSTKSFVGNSVADGIRSTIPSWPAKGTVHILLGDVVFSKAALEIAYRPIGLRFLGKTGPNQFTGKTWSELYSLTFSHDYYDKVKAAIEKSGTLWDVAERLRAPVQECLDYTDDIDSPEELKNMRERWETFVEPL